MKRIIKIFLYYIIGFTFLLFAGIEIGKNDFIFGLILMWVSIKFIINASKLRKDNENSINEEKIDENQNISEIVSNNKKNENNNIFNEPIIDNTNKQNISSNNNKIPKDKINYSDNIRHLEEEFYIKLYDANYQKTKEILEALIEFEFLDNTFIAIKKIKPNFMKRTQYEETKLNILDSIISDKYRKYLGSKKNKNEKTKSLLDELYVCKRRYPEYSVIINKYIYNIKNNN